MGHKKTHGNTSHPQRVLALLAAFFAIALCLAPLAVLAEGNEPEPQDSDPDALQYVKLNASAGVDLYNEIHAGGDVQSYNYIDTNGSVDIYVNGVDLLGDTRELRAETQILANQTNALTGQTNLITGYIKTNEQAWIQDRAGISMGDVIGAFDKITRYKAGDDVHLSAAEQALMSYLDYLAYSAAKDYFDTNIGIRDEALDTYHETIQSNIYDIEAIYRTLEKSDPDTYCKSRVEVAENYGLASVKCGLHSKICYNGDLNLQEGGRDFCVHTDNDKDYIPCYNMHGMCGSLVSVNIAKSEEESYIPIILTYSNPGYTDLEPGVKIDLQVIDTNVALKTFEEDLGILEAGQERTYVIYLNNSGVKPGKYELWITVMSGRKEIIERLEYEILPSGAIEREGTLSLKVEGPIEGGGVEIIGEYANTGDVPYTAAMTLEFYLNGEKITEAESKPVYVIPGENKEIRFGYLGIDFGDYEVVAGIKGTDLSQSVSFSREAATTPEETGKFANAQASTPVALIFLALLLAAVLAHRKMGSGPTRAERVLREELA
ncbi:MAG: hypothetical protein ACP5E4_03955 [Candidatus Aenigmatarchaeota archaeon]